MLGLGRTAVAPGAALQARDQIIVQVSHMQIPGHLALHENNDLIALILGPIGQDYSAMAANPD
jgi:hypothetical protein